MQKHVRKGDIMLLRRKIYDKLLEWKNQRKKDRIKKCLLIKGAWLRICRALRWFRADETEKTVLRKRCRIIWWCFCEAGKISTRISSCTWPAWKGFCLYRHKSEGNQTPASMRVDGSKLVVNTTRWVEKSLL